MELKWGTDAERRFGKVCFNCTFMELKFMKYLNIIRAVKF